MQQKNMINTLSLVIFHSILGFFYITSYAQKADSNILIRTVSKEITGLAVKKISVAILEKNCSQIFDKHCYIGPLFWKKYKNRKEIKTIKEGNITFKVPLNKEQLSAKFKLVDGKLIQNNKDFQIVWTFICNELSKGEVSIRTLTKDEKEYYWGITFFDIAEPLYVMENKEIRLLINQYPKSFKILWIDELSTINL